MIAGAYILGVGAIVLTVVVAFYLCCLIDDSIKYANNVKDHQSWQDNEHERLRQRVAGVDKRVDELNDWNKDFKDALIRERDRATKLEKQIQELNSCINTMIEDIEEMRNE